MAKRHSRGPILVADDTVTTHTVIRELRMGTRTRLYQLCSCRQRLTVRRMSFVLGRSDATHRATPVREGDDHRGRDWQHQGDDAAEGGRCWVPSIWRSPGPPRTRLNMADPLVTGEFGKAVFDAVGLLLLIGWAEVGPALLQAIIAFSVEW
jgi:hypothetical protein